MTTQHAASINQYTTIETHNGLQFIYKTDSASGKTKLSIWDEDEKKYIIKNVKIN